MSVVVNPDIFGEALCARFKAHCTTDEERFEKLVEIVRHTAENYQSLATVEADGDLSITSYLTAFDTATKNARISTAQQRILSAYIESGTQKGVQRKLKISKGYVSEALDVICEKIAVQYAKGDVEAWGR